MTEDEAKAWIALRFGDAKFDRLATFVELLLEENQRQNLIARSTVDTIWSRHIVDSAQLVSYVTANAGRWCDIGSGPGLPGVVVGILYDADIVLVEPRPRRVAFLQAAVDTLLLSNVTVAGTRAEKLPARLMDVITARAVASLGDLFGMCEHLTSSNTRFILPKGRSGRAELASIREQWQGMFHVEQSFSDPESTIIIADGVKRRCSASR